MSDATVAITAGTGTPIDVSSVSTSSGTVNRQRMVIGDDTGADGLAAVVNGSLQTVTPDTTATINITTSTGTQSVSMAGRRSCALVVTSVGTGGQFVVEGSIDGSNWVQLDVYAESLETWITGTITTTGSWWVEALGAMNSVRVRATALTSGSIAGTMLASSATMDTPEHSGGLGAAVPPNAIYMGGNDGTNLRGVSVTTTGVVNTALSPQTSGGLSFTSGSIGATKTVVKASAGQLFGYHIGNSNTSAVYVQIYNVASAGVTVGGTTPDMSLFIPASGGAILQFETGIAFSTAITIAITTTRTGSGAPTNTVDYNIFFK